MLDGRALPDHTHPRLDGIHHSQAGFPQFGRDHLRGGKEVDPIETVDGSGEVDQGRNHTVGSGFRRTS
jgi:hypothetical protein